MVTPHEEDEFEALRQRWEDNLTGDTDYDSSDPDIVAFISNVESKVTNTNQIAIGIQLKFQ